MAHLNTKKWRFLWIEWHVTRKYDVWGRNSYTRMSILNSFHSWSSIGLFFLAKIYIYIYVHFTKMRNDYHWNDSICAIIYGRQKVPVEISRQLNMWKASWGNYDVVQDKKETEECTHIRRQISGHMINWINKKTSKVRTWVVKKPKGFHVGFSQRASLTVAWWMDQQMRWESLMDAVLDWMINRNGADVHDSLMKC